MLCKFCLVWKWWRVVPKYNVISSLFRIVVYIQYLLYVIGTISIHLLGLTFILYLLKLSAGNGFRYFVFVFLRNKVLLVLLTFYLIEFFMSKFRLFLIKLKPDSLLEACLENLISELRIVVNSTDSVFNRE